MPATSTPSAPASTRTASAQRVWLYFAAWQRQYGTAAEYRLPPRAPGRPAPRRRPPYDLGASLGIPALTAHRCLFADGPIDGRTDPGHRRRRGGRPLRHRARPPGRAPPSITTVSSDEKAELARAAGADHIVNYRTGDAEPARAILDAAGGPVDRIVEVAPAANLDARTRPCSRPNGSIVIYAIDGEFLAHPPT